MTEMVKHFLTNNVAETATICEAVKSFTLHSSNKCEMHECVVGWGFEVTEMVKHF